MIAEAAFDVLLALLLLGVGFAVVAVQSSFAAVVAFVAFGLLLSLGWVQLHAADVALMAAAVGGGATGVLLLNAAVRLRAAEAVEASELPGMGMRIAAGVVCVLITAGLAAVVLALPNPAPTLAPEAAARTPPGIANPVTAVLMDYRAFDTLMEKIVLLLALLGVWSVTPDRLWARRPGAEHKPDTNSALTLLGQMLPPAGIVVAIYLLWAGANDPGGVFQGGTILAAMWLLAVRAGLVRLPPLGSPGLRLALIAGPALFFVVGFVGVPFAGAFLAYPAGYEKLLIMAVEIVLLVSIAAIVTLLVTGPPEEGLR